MKGSLTKRGKTSWRYRFDSNRHLGGSRKIISGTIRSTTKKAAEEELRAIMAKHDKGDFVEPNKRTLKEYLEYWLPIIKPSIAPKTFEGDEQKIKKYHPLTRPHQAPISGDAADRASLCQAADRWPG